MRKTSAYARKRRAAEAAPQAPRHTHAWAAAMERRMSYARTQALGGAADALLFATEGSLERMLQGATPADDHGDHDQLMHALGTALQRIQTMGGDVEAAERTLQAGVSVLHYCSTHWRLRKTWPVLSESEREPLRHGIETYRVILLASTPLQMQDAWRAHLADVERRFAALPSHTLPA